MQIKRDSIPKLSLFFIGCLFCTAWDCFDFLDNSLFVMILIVLSLCTIIILLCKELNYFVSNIELTGYILLCFLYWILNGTGAQMNYFLMLLTACIFRLYREKITCKQLFIVVILGVVVYVIARNVNLIQENIYERADGAIRKTLGFQNPNTAAMFFFSLASMLVLIKNIKINWLLFAAIVFWCFYETNTRSMLICSLFFAGSYIVFKHSMKNCKQNEKGIEYIFIVIAFMPFFFGYITKIFPLLDRFSSGRLTLGINTINTFVFKNWMIGGTNAKDNFFLDFVAQYGVIFGIWSLRIVQKAVRNLVKAGNYLYLSYILSYWLYGLFESILFNRAVTGVIAFWIIVLRYAFLTKSFWITTKLRRC